MNTLFWFRCWTPEHDLPGSTLVVFSGPNDFSLGDLTTAISEATKKALSPEALYLFFPEDHVAEVANALASPHDAFEPLSSHTIIGLYGYGKDGSVTRHSSIQGKAPSDLPLDKIRRQGLTALFRTRGGLLESGPTAHFVKPSNDPDTRFLRASNALAEGAEIFFAAVWLLPYLDAEVRYVHVDTSAIASVVMAALLMANQSTVPIVRTFHSYDGLHKHNFNRDRRDLVLISASQSGSMAEEIKGLVSDDTTVLTLFSTATIDQSGVLCDLRYCAVENAVGYPPRRPVGELANSRPIKLISEHFVARPEPPRAIVPSTTGAPKVLREVIAQLQGKNVFLANRTAPSSPDPKAVWVDVDKLQESEVFAKWIAKIARKHVPATTRAIIYSALDPSGRALAESLLSAIRKAGGELKDVEILSLSEIEGATPKWNEPVPAIITGGATGHGAQLQAISRALRDWAPNSYRVYLSSATMPSSQAALKLLVSNLEFSGHAFFSMFELVLDRRRAAESWSLEREFLLDRDDTLPSALQKRLDDLQAEGIGLLNNLFIDSPKGPLKLRDNFAFWPPGTPCCDASQADVFASIACVIENLRTGDVAYEQKLINDPQTHCVISSEAFTRYNDGVIQAAILRVATPVELNYRDSPEHSTLMVELVSEMVELADRDQGEALSEFLMAIALGRMQLRDEDAKSLSAKLSAGAASLSETQKWLAGRINELPRVVVQLSSGKA